jgi:hypothetical protein
MGGGGTEVVAVGVKKRRRSRRHSRRF